MGFFGKLKAFRNKRIKSSKKKMSIPVSGVINKIQAPGKYVISKSKSTGEYVARKRIGFKKSIYE